MTLWGEKISRRAVLRNISALAAGISTIPLSSASKTSAHAAETKPVAMPVPKPLFSLAERDRRWNAIRRIMAESQWNLDAILAPAGSDTAYPRYLTQIGGRGGSADVIFPRDPAKPVYAYTGSGRNDIEDLSSRNEEEDDEASRHGPNNLCNVGLVKRPLSHRQRHTLACA